MKDFTDFDLQVLDIEKEHFKELHKPLNKYFTIYIKIDDSCVLVWEDNCPTIIRNKVIAVANQYLN